MAEIVNFKRAKKAKTRAAAEEKAATNRAQFGTPKKVRDLAKACCAAWLKTDCCFNLFERRHRA